MSLAYRYLRGGAELLDEVVGLWSGLREHVCSRSLHFAEEMRQLTWEERKHQILDKGQGVEVMVDIALSPEGRKLGYCVSTLTSKGDGEVDSIYVEEGSRGNGLGADLLRRSTEWMELRGANSMKLSVTWGNEEVLPFYESHCFYPRSVTLQRKAERRTQKGTR